MVFACNELPRTLDNSDAFFDRIILLTFPYRFEYKDKIDLLPEEERINVKERRNDIVSEISSDKELSGLLNWGLNGLDRLLKQGHFSFTESQKNMKQKYIKLSDSFAAFCSEHIIESENVMIKKEDLRKEYTKYCKLNHVVAVSDKAIANFLTKELGAFDYRLRNYDTDIRVWKNIKFDQGVLDDLGISTL